MITRRGISADCLRVSWAKWVFDASLYFCVWADDVASRFANEHHSGLDNYRTPTILVSHLAGLTLQWVELFNDPLLGAIRPVPSRDVRVAGIFAVFFGAFCSRAIQQSSAGAAGAIGVLCALRFGQVFWWIWTPVVPIAVKG